MDFRELERLFVDHLRQRVRHGEVTERGLARLTGFSQPHIHNVLKGKRSLSPEAADVILHRLGMDLLDLLQPGDRGPPPE